MAILGLLNKYSIFSAISFTFLGSTKNPVSLSTINSGVPPPFVATVGLLNIIYSMIELEIPSPCSFILLDKTPTLNMFTIESTSCCFPTNLKLSLYLSATLFLIASKFGPSPIATKVTSFLFFKTNCPAATKVE